MAFNHQNLLLLPLLEVLRIIDCLLQNSLTPQEQSTLNVLQIHHLGTALSNHIHEKCQLFPLSNTDKPISLHRGREKGRDSGMAMGEGKLLRNLQGLYRWEVG